MQNPAADPCELQRFIGSCGHIALVNLWTGKLEGVAFLRPCESDWQELPVEGPAEGIFRETVVNLVTQWVEQSLPDIAPPTNMDQALSTAAMAVEKMSLQDVVGKLANIVGQAIAWHCGCGTVATHVGAVLQAAVTSMPFPASPAADALNDATSGVVAFDLCEGRLTSTVTKFFVSMTLPKIGGPGRQPGPIRAERESSREGLPQPGEEPPPQSAPTSRDRHGQPTPTLRPGWRRRPGNR